MHAVGVGECVPNTATPPSICRSVQVSPHTITGAHATTFALTRRSITITVPELTQLSPRVFAFSTGHANAYLWRHGRGVTLVDSGEVGRESLVLDAIRRIGRTEQDLVRIVLTHWHHDHSGGAAALAELTGAQVCAGRADAPVIRGQRTGAPAVLTPAEEPLMARIAGQVAPAPACLVHRELDDGDILADPDIDPHAELAPGAVVLAVPGHTPGSIALHLSGERVVLTGDIAGHLKGEHIALGPFNTDREQARHSLRRLATLDVDAAGFGHGTPITRDAAVALAGWTDPLAQ
ncbi:MBL fold metallo-hydrolase [Streptomyces sp. NPDC050619]|uniref:MBL fold metallo-hydrolase n=1 Tax=Streptomyces sp. NPDC050619 TaxID=3157214 RepID=UPI00342D5B89